MWVMMWEGGRLVMMNEARDGGGGGETRLRDLGRIGSERYWGAVWNFGLLEGEEVKFREGSGVRLWFGLNHKPTGKGCRRLEGFAVVAGGGSRVISTDLWFIFSNI